MTFESPISLDIFSKIILRVLTGFPKSYCFLSDIVIICFRCGFCGDELKLSNLRLLKKTRTVTAQRSSVDHRHQRFTAATVLEYRKNRKFHSRISQLIVASGTTWCLLSLHDLSMLEQLLSLCYVCTLNTNTMHYRFGFYFANYVSQASRLKNSTGIHFMINT